MADDKDIKKINDRITSVTTDIEKTLTELDTLDWELFYLGATVDPNVGKLTPVTDKIVRTNFAYTTHAYAINSSMFDFVLEAP